MREVGKDFVPAGTLVRKAKKKSKAKKKKKKGGGGGGGGRGGGGGGNAKSLCIPNSERNAKICNS